MGPENLCPAATKKAPSLRELSPPKAVTEGVLHNRSPRHGSAVPPPSQRGAFSCSPGRVIKKVNVPVATVLPAVSVMTT